MIKAFTENLKSDSVMGSLDIPEGFSQGVGTIITFEVNGFCPCFNESVDGLDGNGLMSVTEFGVKTVSYGIFFFIIGNSHVAH